MDYNINVKLQIHRKQKSTSATGTKVSGTSAGGNTARKTKHPLGDYSTDAGGVKKSMLALKVLMAIELIKKGTTALATGRGTITGNRYREQRSKDTIKLATNPISMGTEALKFVTKQHFEIMRENERIDYNLRRSGNYIPTRSGTGGVTL